MTDNKPRFLLLFLAAGLMLVPLRASGDQPENIRLPSTDFHFKASQDYVESDPDADYRHASAEAIEAFRDIKYGVRIHWGIYSILGQPGESWPFLKMSFQQKQDYQELYKTWNPTGFNADEWIRLFHEAGIRYAVIVPKHHDGFCMFDTKQTDYNIMNSPFGRDVVGELSLRKSQYGLHPETP